LKLVKVCGVVINVIEKSPSSDTGRRKRVT